MGDESYPTDLHLALSLLLYGEYLPADTCNLSAPFKTHGKSSTDYWLIDDDVPERGPFAPEDGLFIRSQMSEPSPLIDLEISEGITDQMQALDVRDAEASPQSERQTLFLAPVPPPAPPLPKTANKDGDDQIDSSTGAGLFVRTDLDDWVVA